MLFQVLLEYATFTHDVCVYVCMFWHLYVCVW